MSGGSASDDVPNPVAVLLDLSGAAGLEKKSPDDLRLVGEFFGERQDILTRVAVLTPSDAANDLLDSGGAFAAATGIPSHPSLTAAKLSSGCRRVGRGLAVSRVRAPVPSPIPRCPARAPLVPPRLRRPEHRQAPTGCR